MSLEDERVLFYLRNRDQIEEWAALRSEAARAIDEWLASSLEPQVRALAAELGPDVTFEPIIADDNPYPGFRLARTAWRLDASEPVVSVCLEWARGRTTLRAAMAPYVGVRNAKTAPLGTALREAESVKRVRTARKDTTSLWWVAYGSVLPRSPFPANESDYRDQLVAALRGTWDAYAGPIDDVVRTTGLAHEALEKPSAL